MIEGFHLLFHESGLAPLFHPLSASFSQKKTLFRGVPGCPQLPSSVRICPRDLLASRKKNLLGPPYFPRPCKFCDLFRWGIFTHFHSARLKTHYILPPIPPRGGEGMGEPGDDVTSLIWPKKSHFVLFNFFFLGASERNFLLKSFLHCKVPNN